MCYSGTTYGTLPQLVLTTLSGRFPTDIHLSPLNSKPTSSLVSLIATSLSFLSLGSFFPPGNATCEVQRSPSRAARLINNNSGSPFCTQDWLKKSASRSAVGGSGY